jgi:SAM-dependent MidA family methyltransferase
MPLASLLKERIRREGPISVADYMEAVVSHYYASRDPFGQAGDFTTAPEISQIFGELMGAWLAGQWQLMGSPKAALLELGPGRGTLMRDVLRATKSVPGFHAAIDLYLLEVSPALEALQHKNIQHPRIKWIRDLRALPSLPLLFIANEFFDALPVRQFVGERERRVGIENDAFCFLPEGNVTAERCEAAESIIAQLAAHIARFGGCGLVIDYGYAGGGQADTLQAVQNHTYADPLASPGATDLTAHVDFGALARAAKGVSVYGPIPQGALLKRLGAELRANALCRNATPEQAADIVSGLERLLSPVQMGELFKAMAFAHPALPTPAGF